MKRVSGSILGLVTLSVITASASAQVYGPDPNRHDRYGNSRRGRDHGDREPYYRGRDRYYGQNGRRSNGPYQPYGNSGSLIARVQSNLSRAAANSYTDGHERGHFNTAQQALSDFQARWSQGRFDTGRLDAAIASLNDLARSDQVNQRDRAILANDLAALRQFRANPQAGSTAATGNPTRTGPRARMARMGNLIPTDPHVHTPAYGGNDLSQTFGGPSQ